MFFYKWVVKQKVFSFLIKSNDINKLIIFSNIIILKVLIYFTKINILLDKIQIFLKKIYLKNILSKLINITKIIIFNNIIFLLKN